MGIHLENSDRCQTMAPSHFVYLIKALSATLIMATMNKSTLEERKGRVFSLFSIVQFPNDACRSTSGTYSNGTCYTSGECSSKGGSAQGNCAAGFGVCCTFSVSATSSRVSENCTYIVNPNYPSNYAPTSTPTTVSYTINKSSNDICRIRLDYDIFVLDQPVTTSDDNKATSGQCSTDRMTMTTTDRATTPATGATATYGQYPYLCGTNTGYHSYLDLSCTSTDSATLSFLIGSTTTNQWKVKVTQYSCNDPGVAAQQGCFQYHTGITGTVQNYNFAGGQQLAGQNYKHCIRQEEGYCCIQYTVISYDMGGGDDDGVTTCLLGGLAGATRCSGASLCSMDFIIIPGAGESPTGNPATPGENYERFCGLNLNAVGFPNQNAPIISCECPFEISHITGIEALTGIAGNSADPPVGFQLSYSQLAGSC